METIEKFRSNFFNKRNPFKVGFNNRSPFSYISSSGPSVPGSYDGGVPLVNFTPDQYARAYDSSDAVRSEHEMYKAKGKAAGQIVSALGAAAMAGAAGQGGQGASTPTGEGFFGDTLSTAPQGEVTMSDWANTDAAKAASDLSESQLEGHGGVEDRRGRKMWDAFKKGGEEGLFGKSEGDDGMTDIRFPTAKDNKAKEENTLFADMTIDTASPEVRSAYFDWKNQSSKNVFGGTDYLNQDKGWQDFINIYK